MTLAVPAPRNRIENRDRAKQLIDFFNMRRGNKSLTDIDGLMEWDNRAYVIIEVKQAGIALPVGQELALTRLCDDLTKAKPTLLIIANHVMPAHWDIDLASCAVAKFRYQGEWHEPKQPVRVKRMVDAFLAKVDKGISRYKI
jgi:hypothetical protein